MSSERPRIRRVLVALDASSPPSAIPGAADLARALEVELAALFLRNPDLRTLAAHPATSQLTLPEARVERWDADRLELELRAAAEKARRELGRAAEARNIPWSFEVREGEPAPEILQAARQADLTAVSIHDPPWRPQRHGEEVGTHVLRSAPGTLYLPRESGLDRRRSIVLFAEESRAGAHALRLARALARGAPTIVRVLVPEQMSAKSVERIRSSLAAERGVTAVIQRIPSASSGSLARLLVLFDRDLVILPRSRELLRSNTMQRLASSSSSSVLIAR